MKKRLVTLSLALCLAFSLAIPAGAAVSNSTANKVEKDMDAMSAVFINTDAVSVSSVENGVVTYAYQLTEDVTDYISVEYNDDGSYVLDIREGDCHDVMTVLKDGTLLIDGQRVEANNIPVSIAAAGEPEIMPMVAFSYSYSESPFAGTTAAQYTVGPVYQNVASVPLAKELRALTGAAVGTVLATAFFPGNSAAIAKSQKVCANIAVKLKTKAETIADAITALSYKMTITGHPKNDTFTFYRKYAGTYYFGKNYTKIAGTHTFYELRTTMS